MNNEDFFLEICRRKYLVLVSEDPVIENGIHIYFFSYLGNQELVNKIMFNQVGGYICMEENIQ